MSPPADVTGRRIRRIATTLSVGYALIVVGILLSPVGYSGAVHAVGEVVRGTLGLEMIRDGMIEAGANVLLFLPLGILLILLTRKPWRGVLYGVLLSLCAEVAQFFIPGRVTSARDIVANTIGVLLGTVVGWLLVRRQRMVGMRDESLSG